MPRYSASVLTGAGSTTLPIFGLYNTAAVRGWVVEIAVWNTTATQVQLAVQRVSTAGTWTSLTEVAHEDAVAAATCTAVHTATGTPPTLVAGTLRVAQLGAAVGSGVIWTFGDRGLSVGALGTGNGIVVVPLGTGQACLVDFTWDE